MVTGEIIVRNIINIRIVRKWFLSIFFLVTYEIVFRNIINIRIVVIWLIAIFVVVAVVLRVIIKQ